jgi:hypothetical protein
LHTTEIPILFTFRGMRASELGRFRDPPTHVGAAKRTCKALLLASAINKA